MKESLIYGDGNYVDRRTAVMAVILRGDFYFRSREIERICLR